MTTKYILEVYQPDAVEDVWVTFESESPFGAISAGDIVNPGLWEGTQSPMKVLEVTRVEHILWTTDNERTVKHKIMVFSREIEGTGEARLR